MIISVFPNLNNKGVSVLAVNVVNKLCRIIYLGKCPEVKKHIIYCIIYS